MNKRLLQLAMVLAAFLLAALACEFSASTAKIEDAWLAHDQAGEQPTIIFAQDEVVYCVVELANAPDDTRVKVVWTAVQVEGEEPNTYLYENELTSGSATLYFELSNSQLWPVGQYKADVYLNDELDRTLDFTVHALETTAPEPTPEPTLEPTPEQPAATLPPPVTSPSISNAFMARDEAGTQPTSVFAQNEIFYCIVEVTDVQEEVVMEAHWYAVQAEGVEPNYLIDTVDISGAYDTFTFNLSNDQLWPLGTYRVEIFMNGTPATALDFAVQ